MTFEVGLFSSVLKITKPFLCVALSLEKNTNPCSCGAPEKRKNELQKRKRKTERVLYLHSPLGLVARLAATQEGPDRLQSALIIDPLSRGFGIPKRERERERARARAEFIDNQTDD